MPHIIQHVRGERTGGKLPKLLETMIISSLEIELIEDNWFCDPGFSQFKCLQWFPVATKIKIKLFSSLKGLSPFG